MVLPPLPVQSVLQAEGGSVSAPERKRMTTTVSIGRNVGSKPMPAGEWRHFRDLTLSVVKGRGKVHFEGVGTAENEESYTIVASIDDPVLIENQLAALASRFEQDSIAITTGETKFVSFKEELNP